jgi:uncharacterized protein (DUF924 family)
MMTAPYEPRRTDTDTATETDSESEAETVTEEETPASGVSPSPVLFLTNRPMPVSPYIEDVLAYWFGPPAQTAPELEAKIVRWFKTGAPLDAEIIDRFGHLVVQGLLGLLDHWTATTRGRLALIIVLDQLTRHVFRGSPRMYDRALDRKLGAEQKLFLFMPFAHAENLALQVRSVDVVRAQIEEAPAALRPALEEGLERALTYRSIIARFGRFPTRNDVLGRANTSDEEEFLRVSVRRSA